MILPIIKTLLSQRLGHPILYPSDCEVLREDIEQSTNQRISVNTLKRLLGFIRTESTPRTYTLDIVAHYLGHVDYKSLIGSLNPDNDESDPITVILADDLNAGDMVRAVWRGGYAEFEALGNGAFVVRDIKSAEGYLLGEEVSIKGFRVGLPLYLAVNPISSAPCRIALASISGIESLVVAPASCSRRQSMMLR